MQQFLSILAIFFYTLAIIWATLMTIRLDVAQQLNQSYEIRDTHRQDLDECYQQLGGEYETH